jgi:hypothetical protein
MGTFAAEGRGDGELKGSNHKKPNVLIIFGDDIGQANLSACSHGMMG